MSTPRPTSRPRRAAAASAKASSWASEPMMPAGHAARPRPSAEAARSRQRRADRAACGRRCAPRRSRRRTSIARSRPRAGEGGLVARAGCAAPSPARRQDPSASVNGARSRSSRLSIGRSARRDSATVDELRRVAPPARAGRRDLALHQESVSVEMGAVVHRHAVVHEAADPDRASRPIRTKSDLNTPSSSE